MVSNVVYLSNIQEIRCTQKCNKYGVLRNTRNTVYSKCKKYGVLRNARNTVYSECKKYMVY